MSKKWGPLNLRIHLAPSVWSRIINIHLWASSTRHTSMFDTWCGLICITTWSFLIIQLQLYVFTFMKVSDCRFLKWPYIQIMFDFCWCCEMLFLRGKDSVIMHFIRFPRSPGPLEVGELVSAFFLCCFGHTWGSIIYLGRFPSFTCTEISVDSLLEAPAKQQPNPNSISDISSRHFASCFICLKIMRNWTWPGQLTPFQSVVQIRLIS